MKAVFILLLSAIGCFGQAFTFQDQPWLYQASLNSSWFVDSVTGNDGNSGRSSASPLKTLATLTTNNIVGASIYLKRGSMFRESFKIPTNSIVQPYGNVSYAPFGSYDNIINNRPIISGADFLTNSLFVLTAGQTNVYEYPYTPTNWSVNEGGNVSTCSNVCIVWENDVRMSKAYHDTGYYSNLNQVITNVPAWWYDPSVHKIYVHATGGINPATNSNVYEASVRKLVFFSGDGFSLYDLQGEKGYQDDGSHTLTCFSGFAGGLVKLCIFRQGYNHVGGVANTIDSKNTLIFDSCIFADPDPFQSGNAAPTAFVNYKDQVTAPYPTTYLTNCSSYAKTILSGNIGYFAHHSSVGSFAHCVLSNCYAMNWDYGSSSTYPSEDLDSPVGFTAINCNLGLHGLGQLASAINVTNFNCINGIQGSPKNVTGCRFYDCSGFPIQLFNLLTSNGTATGVTNCVFHGTGSYAINVPSFSSNTVSVVSNTSSGFASFYLANPANTSNTVTYSDYNDYFGIGPVFAVGLPTNNSYSQWLAAFPALDTHSVTTDPAIAVPIYPTNYILAVAADIPMMLVQPISQSILLTNSFTLSCLGAGFATLLYQWQHAGTNLAGATQTSYAIAAVTNGHEGNYACVITNDLGSVTSSVAVLTITQPAIFTPTNISGYPVAAWYVADDFFTNSGSARLPDRWTNGWHLTQATAANQPSRTNSVNGHSAVYLNGGTFLRSIVFSNIQPHELFVVCQLTNISSTYRIYDSTNTSSRQNLYVSSQNFNLFSGGGVVADGGVITNRYIILDCSWNGSSTVLFVNQSSSGNINPGSASMTGFTLGGRWDMSDPLTGNIAEIIDYSTNFGSSAWSQPRSNIVNYLTNKYNLSVP